jgi:uncharacterized glyoxalase superfamily protein PhnB
MKLNAVGVTSTNIAKTVEFYTILGFKFPEYKKGDQHLEPITPDGSARLMIDSSTLIKEIIGETPKAGNHSNFAIEYNSVSELNEIANSISEAGFVIVKEPWDAFWGQRYAIVEDPDGYKVDLYSNLPPSAENQRP